MQTIMLGSLTIDLRAYRATRGHKDIHLTSREFDLLRYLAERPDAPVDRDQLLAEVWGIQDGSTTRSVDFAVSRLRKKIVAV
jgi:DNA-binding response OmpR family regulator